MNEQVKKKLCWNCEGSVAKHLETCPYCGVYLSPSQQDLQEAPSKTLNPPFPSSKKSPASSLGKPPFQDENAEEVAEDAHEEEESSEREEGSFLSPLLMFIAGTSFGLFGLSLWLFSEGGRLTLSWSEDWASVFMLIALPLLIFGGRSLIRLEDT